MSDYYMTREYLRPWKLITLSIGITILIIGAKIENLPDWDTGISVLMALMTYISAPWVVRVFIERRSFMMPFALFAGWFSVDLIYFAWNWHLGPEMVDIFRQANWLPSLCLYLLCGFFWLYRGSISDFSTNLRALLQHRSNLE